MSSELLTSKVMHQLGKHRFQTKNMKRGHHKGARRSNRQGTSLEFSDYRQYQPGDDLRQIDWNIYARTNKHYIKRFLDEQELVISIYVDCTKSMSTIPEKWRFTKSLAAALGYMSLTADDRVGIFPVGASNPPFSYRKGKAFANRVVHYVDTIKSSEATNTFSESIQHLIQPKSSISVLISDLLEPIETIQIALKKLQAYKQDLYILRLLSPEEVDPFYQGDLELLDSETGKNVNVTMNRAVKLSYQQRLTSHTEKLEKFCFELGIGFIPCLVTDSIEEVLFQELSSKGWI
ncbi:DUF58 domain-containing protein [Ornithinibacillus scapharcae]|uniref:DUF58 domain-containing protein n=1 Tax=Ornithinibacillus scapharcae TaxID=1147159 RepID=UPI000225B345|nr:DUF58 domain-containing protein [Ornithinibacillus scapharcae]